MIEKKELFNRTQLVFVTKKKGTAPPTQYICIPNNSSILEPLCPTIIQDDIKNNVLISIVMFIFPINFRSK